MSHLKQLVARKLEESGVNPFEAARQGGLERSFVNDILIEKKRSVTGANIVKLGRAIGATEAEILEAMGRSSPPPRHSAEPNAVMERDHPVYLPAFGELPVDVEELGVAVGGDGSDESAFEFNGQVADRVRRPPGLMHRKDVFALRVTNLSMYPKFEDGERIFVERRKPLIGDYVVVELNPVTNNAPGVAYIKKLIAADLKKITVEQFNPHGILEFGRHEIRQLFRVIPPAEWLGA